MPRIVPSPRLSVSCRSALTFVIVLLCPLVATVASAQPPVDGAPTRDVEVAAGRFSFVPDVIEVVQGERVRLTIRSVDVEHGFGIAALGIERVIPAGGEPVIVAFVANDIGDFPIHCAVFCGRGHAQMSATLRVRSADSRPTDHAETQGAAGDDFTLVGLPTTRILPRFKSAFRISHRFSRPLGQGDAGDLLGDLFGFDSSALIGLEFRFSPITGGQVGIYRTSDRTIQLFGQYRLLRSATGRLAIDALVAVEGTDNFSDKYSPTVGAVLSWTAAQQLTLYAHPIWVGNSNIPALIHPTLTGLTATEDNTLLVGLAARLQVRPTVYAVVEFVPRLAGFDNGRPQTSVALEKRIGGHAFQINVSNGLGSTVAQMSRGGSDDDWFIGFNITRHFF